MLAKFRSQKLAEAFSGRVKGSGIVLGDDGRYWVVTLSKLNELEKAGYSVL